MNKIVLQKAEVVVDDLPKSEPQLQEFRQILATNNPPCFLILLYTSIFNTTAQTPRTEVNISTGNESGEYYAIAKDIDVDVFPTRGALQNIVNVYEHESLPLGIS